MDGLSFKIFSVSEVREWLIHNVHNAISESCITPTRALSLVNNPHAVDTDPVLCVVFNNDVIIGYTAVFPEVMKHPSMEGKYYWGTTEWLNPAYRGKGIAAQMMRTIKNAVQDRYLGLDSSDSSVRLDQKQGSRIIYYPRYYLRWGAKRKNCLAQIKVAWVRSRNMLAIRQLERQYEYRNRHVPFIDDATYSFIAAHSEPYLFLRDQQMLNWLLRYPFLLSVGDDKHLISDECEFGEQVKTGQTKIVQVFVDKSLIGVYVLRIIDNVCSLLYLYYDKDEKEKVFASVLINACESQMFELRTFSKDLYQFAKWHGIMSIHSKSYQQPVSFTLPKDMQVDETKEIQGGDGDMFC